MITGLLEERPLPVVLQQLYSLRFTGELALNTRAGLIQVYLREGYPVYVNLPESGDLLGRIMIEMRALTEASVRRALASQAGEGVRLGDVLLQLGLCDEAQLKQALRAQVRRKLHRLFALSDGGYAAIPGDHGRGLQGGESLRVHPYRVIYHGVRSFPPERLKALLRPLAGQAFRLPAEASAELGGRFSFGAEEVHLLQLLRRGFWTLHEITEVAGLEGGVLAAALYTLLSTEQLEVGPEGSQPQARDQITDLPSAPPAATGHATAATGHAAAGTGHGPAATGHATAETGHATAATGHAPAATGHAPAHAPSLATAQTVPALAAAAEPPLVLELAPPVIELAPPPVIELGPPAAERPPAVERPLVIELAPPVIELGPPAAERPQAAEGPPVIELGPPVIELAPPVIELGPPAIERGPSPAAAREPSLSLELERGPAPSPSPGPSAPAAAAPRPSAPSRSAASAASLPRLSTPSGASGAPPAPAAPPALRDPAPGATSAASLARSGREVSTTPARPSFGDTQAVTGRTLPGTLPGTSPSGATSANSARLPSASQPSLPAQRPASAAARPAQRPVSFEELALLRAEIENKAKVIEDETLFAALGISQDADAAEVKAAYLQAAKRFHPDRVVAMGLQALREQAERIFRRVNEAQQVLSDPERREEYVAELRLKDASGDKLLKEKELAVKAVNAELAFSRGIVYLRKRDYGAAGREFDEAVRLNPNEGEHVGYAVWARYCAGKTPAPDAGKEMVRAIRMAPKCGRLHYFLGVLYKQDGADDRAYQSFKKAYELDGRIDEAQSEIRLLDARRGKRGGAPRPVSGDSSKTRGASSESQKSDKGHEKKRGLLDMLRPGPKK